MRADVGEATLTVTVNSDQALARIRELKTEAEPLMTLLETKWEWRPWAVSTVGWIVALALLYGG